MSKKYDRQIVFANIRERLLSEGYTEQVKTISVLKANLMAFVTAGPIAIICAVTFFMVRKTAGFRFGLSDMLWFLLFIFASIIVHELIHGATWALFCKNGFKSIHFGIIWKMLTPYCCCEEPLKFRSYLLGGLMPFFVLGLGIFVLSLVSGSLVVLNLALLNILAAGGDLTIALSLLKHRDAVILDHPSECGFVAFSK